VGHDTISFDVEDANRSIAVILRELDKFKVAMKKLGDAVKESETWWAGSSRAPFMRKANEIMADSSKGEAAIAKLADDILLVIRSKQETDAKETELINSQDATIGRTQFNKPGGSNENMLGNPFPLKPDPVISSLFKTYPDGCIEYNWGNINNLLNQNPNELSEAERNALYVAMSRAREKPDTEEHGVFATEWLFIVERGNKYHELFKILKDPVSSTYGSIYAPVDIHEEALDFLQEVIALKGGTADILDPDSPFLEPLVLASIGLLVAYIDPSDPESIISGMRTLDGRWKFSDGDAYFYFIWVFTLYGYLLD
jgi:hypothetical protein